MKDDKSRTGRAEASKWRLTTVLLVLLLFTLQAGTASAASYSSRLWPSMKLNRKVKRIAPEVAAQLIYFIQHNDRVAAFTPA